MHYPVLNYLWSSDDDEKSPNTSYSFDTNKKPGAASVLVMCTKKKVESQQAVLKLCPSNITNSQL